MPIAPQQLELIPFPKSKTAHGGSHSKGKRKAARPLCIKRSMHVVLRAECARGKWSLLHPNHVKRVFQLLQKYSRQFEVRVYDYANVSNHIHLLVKAKTKEGLRNFLRAFAGHSAQIVTGSGSRKPLKSRFWTLLVFTRIIEWGRAFINAKNYLLKNIKEAANIRKFYPLTI